jgi:LacI family transcriptional regulator
MGTIPFEPLVIETIEDPVVAAVLKGVREAVGKPVSGRALQALAHLSRRGLEQRFRTTLGCSPMQAVRRVNLERAAIMLGETNLSIKEIAKHCCFGSAVHLSVAFKKQYGICPRHFRRQGRRLRPSDDGRSPRRAG